MTEEGQVVQMIFSAAGKTAELLGRAAIGAGKGAMKLLLFAIALAKVSPGPKVRLSWKKC